MPIFAVTIDHTGTITAVQPALGPLHEIPAPVPTEAGATVQRLVQADNANAARELVQAQLDSERATPTAPPPPPRPPEEAEGV